MAVFGLMPYDGQITAWFSSGPRTIWWEIAGGLRKWGEFTDTIFFTGVCFLAGVLFRRRDWRLLAIAAFLAAVRAGLNVNLIRMATGRPRPTEFPDTVWRGPTMRAAHQSFPSGHTGTSVACATALLVGMGALGLPAMVSAGLISWASVYHLKHYPSDVLFGAGLGVLIGWIMARGACCLARDPPDQDSSPRPPPQNDTQPAASPT